METGEQPFDEKQSLQVIQSMIDHVKSDIREDGFHFLWWGWLVFVTALMQYVLLNFLEHAYHWLPWPVMMTLGGIVAGIKIARDGKKAKVRTYFDEFMAYLWSAFVISLLIVILFMHVNMETSMWPRIYPVLMVLYGIGTFVTGGALRFRPLIIGGICCWMIAILAFFVSFKFQLLLIALCVLLSYIIPGHILKSKA